MDLEQINVAFCNLGWNEDKQEPFYPSLGQKFRHYPFKKLWSLQEQMDPDKRKGECGAIFPHNLDTFIGIDKMREKHVLGNGLLFADIDIEDIALRDKIFNDLCKRDTSETVTIAKTGKGMHIIGLCEPRESDKYEELARYFLCYLASEILTASNVDLRDVPKSLDTHNTNMSQRFFLRYSPKVFWASNPREFDLDHTTKDYFREKYPMCFKPKKEYSIAVNKNIHSIADVETIEPDQPAEYIEHSTRWHLFDSICACVRTEQEAMDLWAIVVKYIPTHKHSKEFFLNEPKRNSWWNRYCQNPSTYINYSLLHNYGLEVSNKRLFTKRQENNSVVL